MEHFLYAGHYWQHFTCIVSSNPPSLPLRQTLPLAHFTDEEAEALEH